ncbi:uncharacterized protein LOC131483916 [Neofelis nebulosa]|uniref:uncharacterized protein LOC131483916 n=1 Tax=Neofelis nebulosa TaxID=61452 RepID=UPI00272D7DBF|nr:uncharacterized protein LOC131483916 [Neofelis nebulosa]
MAAANPGITSSPRVRRREGKQKVYSSGAFLKERVRLLTERLVVRAHPGTALCLLRACRRYFCTILGVQTYRRLGGGYPGVEGKETAQLTSPPTLRAALQLPGALAAPPPAVPCWRRAGGLFLPFPGVGGRVQRLKARAYFHLRSPSSQTQAAGCPKEPSSSSLFPEAQAAQVPSLPRQAPAGSERTGRLWRRAPRARRARAGPLSRARAAAPGARTRFRSSERPRRPRRRERGPSCSRSASGPLRCQRSRACVHVN